MIADIVTAVMAAKMRMDHSINQKIYLVAEYEDTTGEMIYNFDIITVTGFRVDGDILNLIIEYGCGDIDELSLTEFANTAYATEAAAQQEIDRRKRGLYGN